MGRPFRVDLYVSPRLDREIVRALMQRVAELEPALEVPDFQDTDHESFGACYRVSFHVEASSAGQAVHVVDWAVRNAVHSFGDDFIGVTAAAEHLLQVVVTNELA